MVPGPLVSARISSTPQGVKDGQSYKDHLFTLYSCYLVQVTHPFYEVFNKSKSSLFSNMHLYDASGVIKSSDPSFSTSCFWTFRPGLLLGQLQFHTFPLCTTTTLWTLSGLSCRVPLAQPSIPSLSNRLYISIVVCVNQAICDAKSTTAR